MPDDATDVCLACKENFGVFTRKHHCRWCGQIFCNDCSVTGSRYYPERICHPCEAHLASSGAARLADDMAGTAGCRVPLSNSPSPIASPQNKARDPRREQQMLLARQRMEEEQLARALAESAKKHEQEERERAELEQQQFELAMEEARRESEALAKQREKDREVLVAKLAEIGLLECEIERDGNCQFHAIAHELEEEITHSALRERLVEWLVGHSSYLLSPEDPHTALVHYLDMDPNWESFCDRMRKEGQYGDHLTLIAAAECTASSIMVITSQAEGVNFHIVPREVTPMRTVYLVHYPLQLHFNLALEASPDTPCEIEVQRLKSNASVQLSEHLFASFNFLVTHSEMSEEAAPHRVVSTFHPITQRLSVGTQDLKGWVATECGSAPTQVSLQWKDEEGDWIDFDTEGELCAAVQSLAARGRKLARVNAIIIRHLDSVLSGLASNTLSTDGNESGVGWVLVEPADTESPTNHEAQELLAERRKQGVEEDCGDPAE